MVSQLLKCLLNLKCFLSIANQVKIETGDFPLMNSNILMEDIQELLSMNTGSGVSGGFVDTHDDSSTDLFPDLGEISNIDPLIATY